MDDGIEINYPFAAKNNRWKNLSMDGGNSTGLDKGYKRIMWKLIAFSGGSVKVIEIFKQSN